MRRILLIAWIVGAALAATSRAAEPVIVGSKQFTEGVVLGQLAAQIGRSAGVATVYEDPLGGTKIPWKALLSGEIDCYPEYTGTIALELLPGTATNEDALRAALARRGIGMTRSLGFNDTYALGMTAAAADRLHIRSISDLRNYPNLRMGFSNEFMDRKDCWPAVKSTYGLPQTNLNGLEHNLAYRAVVSGNTDVVDLYSTEPEIAFYHLRVLDDDKRCFPEYQAVYLYRLDLERRAPAFVKAIRRLEGMIDERRMMAMNSAVTLDKLSEARVASNFLLAQLQIKSDAQEVSIWSYLLLRTREHLFLVAVSLVASIILAVPLGIMAFAWPRVGHVILAVVAGIYTIPSLALLVFMIPLFGIGTWPAIVALFLYSLLPIVRNTHTGLAGIPRHLRESAVVLGLSPMARLLKVELPMAAPSILAGIKTAAVINVGTATIGALIGAGGYGQPILTGIRLADTHLILLGAVPAAMLALLVQAGFGLVEIAVVPRGLRLKSRS